MSFLDWFFGTSDTVQDHLSKEGPLDGCKLSEPEAILNSATTALSTATTALNGASEALDQAKSAVHEARVVPDALHAAVKSKIGSKDVELGSLKYYSLCAIGGALSCGLTHSGITPLDLVKCRMQVDPNKYKSIFDGFKCAYAEDGLRGLTRGWAAAYIGYSFQGVGKFGFYEVFKTFYSKVLGDEKSYTYRTSLYLAAAASAEVVADVFLCPFEACKVRIQTHHGCDHRLRNVFPMIYKTEGVQGFYKGLAPLLIRQIPYTMMKFACFERTLEALYRYVVPKPRDKCNKAEQLAVTFVAGYIAGIFCAVVSHPADTVVSKLNQSKGSNAFEVARKLGVVAMWKGLVARIVMIGTLTGLQWFIYDGFKVAMNLPRPPPPQMPESLRAKLKNSQS